MPGTPAAYDLSRAPSGQLETPEALQFELPAGTPHSSPPQQLPEWYTRGASPIKEGPPRSTELDHFAAPATEAAQYEEDSGSRGSWGTADSRPPKASTPFGIHIHQQPSATQLHHPHEYSHNPLYDLHSNPRAATHAKHREHPTFAPNQYRAFSTVPMSANLGTLPAPPPGATTRSSPTVSPTTHGLYCKLDDIAARQEGWQQ